MANDQTNPNITLADTIVQFKTDAGLAHQFTNGGPTDDVISAGGTYPSLAKIAAESQAAIAKVIQTFNLGITVKTFQFAASLQVSVKHEMNTTNFSVSIVNVQGVTVYAPITVIDVNEFLIDFTEEEAGIANVIFYVDTQVVQV